MQHMISGCEQKVFTINTSVLAAFVDKPHPEFGNLNFGQKIWKEIKINQKWRGTWGGSEHRNTAKLLNEHRITARKVNETPSLQHVFLAP